MKSLMNVDKSIESDQIRFLNDRDFNPFISVKEAALNIVDIVIEHTEDLSSDTTYIDIDMAYSMRAPLEALFENDNKNTQNDVSNEDIEEEIFRYHLGHKIYLELAEEALIAKYGKESLLIVNQSLSTADENIAISKASAYRWAKQKFGIEIKLWEPAAEFLNKRRIEKNISNCEIKSASEEDDKLNDSDIDNNNIAEQKQTSTSDTSSIEVSPVEVSTTEVSPVEVSTTEVSTTEVSPVEVSPTEVSPIEVSPIEVSPTEVSPIEVSATDVSPTEVSPTEVSPTEVSPTEVSATDVSPKQEFQSIPDQESTLNFKKHRINSNDKSERTLEYNFGAAITYICKKNPGFFYRANKEVYYAKIADTLIKTIEQEGVINAEKQKKTIENNIKKSLEAYNDRISKLIDSE